MNSHTLRMRECLVKLEYEKKMSELELEDYTSQPFTQSLDEYSRDVRQHRIDSILLKIRRCQIEMKYLLSKLSVPSC